MINDDNVSVANYTHGGMNGNNIDENCRNTVVHSSETENTITENGEIENVDLAFINNPTIKKYLISDYFKRIVANKVVTTQENSGTIAELICETTTEDNIESAEELETRKSQTVKTIKNKNNVQQHIMKRPRANDT